MAAESWAPPGSLLSESVGLVLLGVELRGLLILVFFPSTLELKSALITRSYSAGSCCAARMS